MCRPGEEKALAPPVTSPERWPQPTSTPNSQRCTAAPFLQGRPDPRFPGPRGRLQSPQELAKRVPPLREAVCYSIPSPQHSWLRALERREGLT